MKRKSLRNLSAKLPRLSACLFILLTSQSFLHGRILSPPPSFDETFVHTESRCTNLLQYIKASPDQQNGGTCLYMAITGIGEMALGMNGVHGCSADLSERYAMNLGQKYLPAIKNWKTDMILLFNMNNGSCLNKDYRYTKGWYIKDHTDGTGPNGCPDEASPHDPGAFFGTYYNWVTGHAFASLPTVPLPQFRRTVLFKSPGNSPFETGVIKRETVEAVKHWIYTKNRPVLIIYNHFGYWHGVIIAGYDDSKPSSSYFTKEFISYMNQRALFYEKYGDNEKARSFRSWAEEAEKSLKAPDGASTGKGVFFVRDSIYPNLHSAETYDYVPSFSGEEAPLTLKWVEHDYTWLMHLGNHVIGIDYDALEK